MAGHLESLKYKRGSFQILNQLKVPHELSYREINSVDDAVDAIKTMQVRGAPLIAIVGCLGLAIELAKIGEEWKDNDSLIKFVGSALERLIDARPTAVNMRKEAEALLSFCYEQNCKGLSAAELQLSVVAHIEKMLQIDLNANKMIGKHGAEVIEQEGGRVKVLTHCNTGSLATAGYGTALGVIRALHESSLLERAFFTETRPYNQGSRLTSFELLHEKIPSTLVCDSAVSWLMKTQKISAVVVGADRIVLNGDTANKIGTYQIAVTARAHQVPFYVAAPFSSIDPTIASGNLIKIEERAQEEITHMFNQPISPAGVVAWNPGFDVTPHELIAGIITEKGVFTPAELTNILKSSA